MKNPRKIRPKLPNQFVTVTSIPDAPPRKKPRPYRKAHKPKMEDIALEFAAEEMPLVQEEDAATERRRKYGGRIDGPKPGEKPDAYVERKLEELVIPAVQELEFAVKFGDDKTRLETAKDVLERRGFARNDQRVKNGLPQAPLTVVFNTADLSKLGFVSGTSVSAKELPNVTVNAEEDVETMPFSSPVAPAAEDT